MNKTTTTLNLPAPAKVDAAKQAQWDEYRSVFPIYVAWLSRWYGSGAKRVSALMFSMASLGGAAVPWVVGVVSEHAGGLRVGLLLPPLNALAMIVLLVLLRRRAATV